MAIAWGIISPAAWYLPRIRLAVEVTNDVTISLRPSTPQRGNIWLS